MVNEFLAGMSRWFIFTLGIKRLLSILSRQLPSSFFIESVLLHNRLGSDSLPLKSEYSVGNCYRGWYAGDIGSPRFHCGSGCSVTISSPYYH